MPNPWETAPAAHQDAKPWESAPSEHVEAPKTDVLKTGPAYGMNDDQILQAAGYTDSQIKQIKSSSSYKPGFFAGMMTNPESIGAKLRNAKYGPQDYALEALGQPNSAQLAQVAAHGFATPFNALAEMSNHALGSLGVRKDEDVLFSDAYRNIQRQNFKNTVQAYNNNRGGTPFFTKAAEFTGQAAPYLLLGTEEKAAEGATLLPRIFQGAKTGAKLGALAGALTPVEDPQADFWRSKAFQVGGGAAGGGLLGGAAPVVTEKIISPLVNKATNVVQGNMAPLAAELEALGKKYGVRLSYGDITGGPFAKKAETALESVPVVGMAGFREAQQKEAQTAAQGLSQSLKERLQASAGTDDWIGTLQKSLKDKFTAVRTTKNALYQDVADAAGTKTLGLPKTLDALEEAAKQNQASGLPDSGIQGTIDTLKQRLYQGRDSAGKVLPTEADTTFTGMQKTRSDLGDQITKLTRAGDAKGVRILQGVKDAVNQDMQDFATKSGDPTLMNAWKKADSYYKNSYVPLKDKAIQNAMGSATPDEIYANFIKSGKGDRASNFYNALDPKGQDAVRYGMVNNALEKATNPNGTFSPAKFAGSLENMDAPASAIFKGQGKIELNGFVKLMRHVERAGQYAENPPTGNRLVPLLLGGETVMHPQGAAVTAASALGLKTLFTSAAGKRLLLAASDAEPGSLAMQKIVQKISTVVGAETGASKPVIPLQISPVPAAADNSTPAQTAQVNP